jgi:D-alanyl-D-alanine carboxypeptidase/D-alanyl-D-alanine-endopeptidase (penicillin-binding protein 4)
MTPAQPSPPIASRRSILRLLAGAPLALSGLTSIRDLGATRLADAGAGGRLDPADPSGRAEDLATTIQSIIDRPQFHGSHWGMSFSRSEAAGPIYGMNSGQLFVSASAGKVFTAGTAFSTLGPEYRFHTPVYRTGPVRDGVLEGDLVLVASGDLLISNRIRPDGTLALPIPDHSYDLPNTMPVPGDPLVVIRKLAAQVAAHGITRVRGRVLVDASLFRQAQEGIGVGAAGLVTISPMMINDNIIDVLVTPGRSTGAPGMLDVSPRSGYVQIQNQVTTIPASDASSAKPLRFVNDVTNLDGTHTVTLVGDIPLSVPHLYRAYYVPDPLRFAELVLAEALRAKGVDASADLAANADPTAAQHTYTAGNLLAEHVSPPLREEVEVMLKTSSNVHTAMWLYDLGAIAGHDSSDPKTAYRQLLGKLFASAGLSPSPPGSADGEYTPDFFVRFLAYIAGQPYFRSYRNALPIMGRDGSLAGVQVRSPAAGHVFAKTGTGLGGSASGPMLEAALAGYIRPPDGGWIVFAQFMDMPIASPTALGPVANAVDDAMGEIATAVYESA